MLEKLKAHWQVNGLNLVLIIATFALGGSLCGWAGRKVLLLTGLEKGILWIVLYVLLVTLLWPVCVLLISIPMGQFRFFKKYILKIWAKMTGKRKTEAGQLARIAIFASGAGSNAEQIIMASAPFPFQREMGKTKSGGGKAAYTVAVIVCNKPDAGVLNIAEREGIPVLLIEKERFSGGDGYLPELHKYEIDFIVLAGFLWKVPSALINAYPKKIINIHPALLPKYGGKGMHGSHVHAAVIAAGETESGISIHFVDELYDHGEVIFQAKCPVLATDTAISLAKKIHTLEHTHYPRIIADIIQKQNRS